MDSKLKVLETLKQSESPLKSGDIAEKTGLDKKEVDKWIKTLKSEDLISSPKRCFYEAK